MPGAEDLHKQYLLNCIGFTDIKTGFWAYGYLWVSVTLGKQLPSSRTQFLMVKKGDFLGLLQLKVIAIV